MAAVAEDDETWLYGDAPKDDSAPVDDTSVDPGVAAEKQSDKEAGELSGEEGEQKKALGDDEEDDDEDSDDDVQVTIGDIKPQTYDAPKFKSGYQRPAAQGSTSVTKAQPKGIDLESHGTINGVSVYELDLESLQADEKPWRKPGADITDYFNYGFNEETWAKYSERQRNLRNENNVPNPRKIYIPSSISTKEKYMSHRQPDINKQPQQQPVDQANGTSGEPLSPGRRAGPPPGRKVSGTIDVIGSTTSDSRRPVRDFNEEGPGVASAEAQDFKKYPVLSLSNPVPHQGMPPVNLPPPDFSTPPPGHPVLPPPGAPMMGPPPMGVPPPQGVPLPNMAAPPPGFPPPPIPADPYESFYPPGHGGPPPDRGPPMGGYDDRPPFGYGPPGPFGHMPNSGPPPWDARGDNFNRGWNYAQGPPQSDTDFSSSEDERDRRTGYRDTRPPRDYDSRDHYRRDRERSRSRERRRDRDRDRERERDRDRDRDRDRERDRDKDRDKDREERHRSRRKRDEDDDHHRSKHKKSKRSKRERTDEESGGGGGGGEATSSQNEDTPAPQ